MPRSHSLRGIVHSKGKNPTVDGILLEAGITDGENLSHIYMPENSGEEAKSKVKEVLKKMALLVVASHSSVIDIRAEMGGTKFDLAMLVNGTSKKNAGKLNVDGVELAIRDAFNRLCGDELRN